MNKFTLHTLVPALILAVLLAGCGGDEPPATATVALTATEAPALPTPTLAPSGETTRGQASVDSIEINILESFPVQVNVVARGELPDGCTQIDEIVQQREGNAFQVVITTVRPGDVDCTEAIVPFEETISLDVAGLDAGAYSVSVNGRTGSFTLETDNSIEEEPTAEPTIAATATPTATETMTGAISGRVWHDLCAVSGEGEEASGSEGCVPADNETGFRANGELEADEPGIEGVAVALSEGTCPATAVSELATSDVDGSFSFTGLAPGPYCVTVDALDDANSDILLPGDWTNPADDNDIDVTLTGGETVDDANFGWDYQNLPVADLENCTNSIEFVEDLSIPDDTAFTPGETFTKTWRLRNNGDCPWTPQYALTYVGGDAIPGPGAVPLSTTVNPGQAIDVSIGLTAPEEFGTYRNNYQIADAEGEPFGINGFIEDAFWVQIVVAEAAATPVPGSGVIGGVVWDDVCFLTGDGTLSANCVERGGEGSGVYIGDGTYTGDEVPIADLTISLSEETCPDGALPSNVIATATTDADGLYRFTDLDEGIYCVFINAFSEANVDLLIPGDWTYPAPGVGRFSVNLGTGEEILDVDFGWDYQ